ncbi:unnamed protein product [Echinostoma caproni]|uniref:DNA_LIGASE_A3 domain-containing protein n=1 Tax=Echinostoma caproni TaxID=27848 RepID=A0A183AM54_9TREM|nr:unnamed protein product [Echinostoma caproni]
MLFLDLGGYKGDFAVLFRLLLPKESKLVYNLKDKQLINVFSQIFITDKEEMSEDLETAEDAATTIGKFFENSDTVKPASKSTLTLKEGALTATEKPSSDCKILVHWYTFSVDDYLHKLASLSKDPDRVRLLTLVTKRCTVRDLISFVRLIRQDLRINAGNKQILDGLHPQAYTAYQASRDLDAVIKKVLGTSTTHSSPTGSPTKGLKQTVLSSVVSTGISLMKPIKPMLAEACKSATQALAKAKPSGKLLAEIKYDGERIQVHKEGAKFSFYSRSLKPAASNKRTAFQDATVCIFAFDCMYLNGQSLTDNLALVSWATTCSKDYNIDHILQCAGGAFD